MDAATTVRCQRCSRDLHPDAFRVRKDGTVLGRPRGQCLECCERDRQYVPPAPKAKRHPGKNPKRPPRRHQKPQPRQPQVTRVEYQPLQPGDTYDDRNYHLSQLGFADYLAYLESPLWKRIRASVWVAKGRNCYLCNSPAKAVHHYRYDRDTLAGNNLAYLFPLCEECHNVIEYDGHQKHTVRQAQQMFDALLRCKGI